MNLETITKNTTHPCVYPGWVVFLEEKKDKGGFVFSNKGLFWLQGR